MAVLEAFLIVFGLITVYLVLRLFGASRRLREAEPNLAHREGLIRAQDRRRQALGRAKGKGSLALEKARERSASKLQRDQDR